MGKLLDFHGAFARRTVTCRHCSWSGLGADMKDGDSFGDGIDKHCPACGERWGFVQWSVTVSDDPPANWESKIGRVEY